jgi:hypothetical protein
MATQLIIVLGGVGGKAPHGPVYFKLFQHPLCVRETSMVGQR